MRKLIIVTSILFSANAFSRKPASIEYNCSFEWQTMSEALIKKEKVVRDLVEIKMNKDITVSLNLQDEAPKIKVVEHYSDNNPKNFLEYNFSCSRTLSCKGNRVNTYEGKSEKTNFSIVPSGRLGIGAILGRELFIYENQNKSDFDFYYSIYKDESGKPMGLKVSCKE